MATEEASDQGTPTTHARCIDSLYAASTTHNARGAGQRPTPCAPKSTNTCRSTCSVGCSNGAQPVYGAPQTRAHCPHGCRTGGPVARDIPAHRTRGSCRGDGRLRDGRFRAWFGPAVGPTRGAWARRGWIVERRSVGYPNGCAHARNRWRGGAAVPAPYPVGVSLCWGHRRCRARRLGAAGDLARPCQAPPNGQGARRRASCRQPGCNRHAVGCQRRNPPWRLAICRRAWRMAASE